METPRNLESKEEQQPARAVVFVPGLGESAVEIYRDVAELFEEQEPQDENTAPTRFFAVGTHPDEESDIQHKRPQEYIAGTPEDTAQPPIMCYVSDPERTEHASFEGRVALVAKALEAAKESGAKEISLVGHSAGGAAVVAALAREIENRKNGEEDSAIHAVLIAPAVPGDVKKVITTEPTFLKIMLKNLFAKVFSGETSYAKHLQKGTTFTPEEKDLAEILGPMEDEAFMQHALKGSVPISGGEGADLLMYPKTMMGISKEDWPENVRVDVVIPESDRWVSRTGQRKLAELLVHLSGGKTNIHGVTGGHLPLGKDDAAEKIVEILQR